MRWSTTSMLAMGGLIAVGALAGALNAADEPSAKAKPAQADRFFEMRTYHTHPGRLDALNKRFRDHTCGLFKKHGMDLVGFWTPAEGKDGKDKTLVYLLAYPSREAREASWKAFQADPDWQKAKAASEADGPIVEKIESVFLNPTDYSTVK